MFKSFQSRQNPFKAEVKTVQKRFSSISPSDGVSIQDWLKSLDIYKIKTSDTETYRTMDASCVMTPFKFNTYDSKMWSIDSKSGFEF